jgi:acyl-CoA dehydrogenase
MAFYQTPPELGNQFTTDRVLVNFLKHKLPPEIQKQIWPALTELGELAGGELFRLQQADRQNEPRLISWDPWGKRVDEIQVTEVWKRAAPLAATYGLVATGYDRPAWEHYARLVQFSLVYLFSPSVDTYACPLAMTDGAARTLLVHGNPELMERAFPRLTSRDPDFAWTSGQWMTERTGGSDVGISETIAKFAQEHGEDVWRLHGTKWFTSATTSDMALTLARPEGNPDGGRGLALFYVEQRLANGLRNNILVNRLKDKLGTRKLPTAELTLDGTIATPVIGLTGGTKAISPMLNITRTWNSVSAMAGVRRGLALARDYASKRVVFGNTLSKKPLHIHTLAGLQAEFEAGFQLSFYATELMGKVEQPSPSERELLLYRMVTPMVKATTGKQVMPILSEVLEAFGGAGYVEDTGLPSLLRDAQVGPIWEGTTNVLSLDVLRSLGQGEGLRVLHEEIQQRLQDVTLAELQGPVHLIKRTVEQVSRWLQETFPQGRDAMEGGARGLVLTLGRTLALALLCEHAQWCHRELKDPRSCYAAQRFADHGINHLLSWDQSSAQALAMDIGPFVE